jgi:hypothetical protein
MLVLHYMYLTFQDLEQIKHRQSERDLIRLNCEILEAWKRNCNTYNVRPTLRDIGRAFGNIGKLIKMSYQAPEGIVKTCFQLKVPVYQYIRLSTQDPIFLVPNLKLQHIYKI